MRFRYKVSLFIVSLPVGGVAGLGGWIKYRQLTRPARHVFHEVLDDRGALILEGRTIPVPTTFNLIKRSCVLATIFTPMMFLYPFMVWWSKTYYLWVFLMLKAIELAGPVFVKLGQWCCTREDVFSAAFREQCKRLYNETCSHSFSQTLRTLKSELEEDPYNIFEVIESKTVGSGSIGQVHAAKLKGSDKKVVIKVMHPKIEEKCSLDFFLLQNCAYWVDRLVPSMNRYELPRLARSFSVHLASQLDFRIEAENLEQFRHNFRHSSQLLFPEPLRSTQRVLVETFCEGKPAHPEYMASLPPAARSSLALLGLNSWCQMLLHDNFIHGDMHPGNILIDLSHIADPHIYLIDVGLSQQLSNEESEISQKLMESFVRWNADQCSESIWEMAQKQRFGNKEVFFAKMKVLFSQFRPTRNCPNAVTRMLESIFHAVAENHVQMDPPFVSLLFSVLILESFLMNLDPDFDLVRHTAPWLVSEGSISKGVIKNFVKSHWHSKKQQLWLRYWGTPVEPIAQP